MTVITHTRPASCLTQAELDRWRDIPAAVAVDLGGDIGQIDPAIRPLNPPGRQPRLFGRAVTAQCEAPDFGAVLHALDVIAPGDVLVIATGGHVAHAAAGGHVAHAAAGGHVAHAMVGEILGGHLRRRGARGLVCDGAVRDVAALAAWPDFAVFARHVTARGPTSSERGAVNSPVIVGGQRVAPGDLIIGDDDGLAVLPEAAVTGRIAEAEAKLAREAVWIESLAGGRSVRETFGL